MRPMSWFIREIFTLAALSGFGWLLVVVASAVSPGAFR